MAFKDFNDVFEPLVLPIAGKAYTIPPASFEAGARLQGLLDGTETMGDAEGFALILGPAYDEMRADNVPDAAILRAFQAAMADAKYGRAMAETLWETGGDPKALEARRKQSAPNRAARRSKGSGGAKKTR